MKRVVAISIYGQNKDYLNHRKIVKKNKSRLLACWRPSVALAAQKEFQIDEYHLICTASQKDDAQTVVDGINHFSPYTKVTIDVLDIRKPFDFQTTFITLVQFASRPCFHNADTEYLIHLTTGTHVEQICLFLLAQKHYLNGKLVQTYQEDAKRFSDPIGHNTVVDLNLSAYDKLKQYFKAEENKSIQSLKAGINTKNRRYNKTIDEIESVIARDKSPLLLTGPTGSGKTELARRIYQQYKDREIVTGDFVPVNCAAIPPDLVESELFGHLEGAFTGAIKNKTGKIKLADKGVLFLDEIGELSLDAQAKILKAIEEHKFTKVGDVKEDESDFILISGTNKDLNAAVAKHEFREDLLWRINLWTYELPSLAERREDIEPNIDYELSKFENETQQHIEFNKEGRDAFLAYANSPETAWRGNFREFCSMIHRMAVFADDGIITEGIVRNEIVRNNRCSIALTSDDALVRILGPDYQKHIDPIDAIQLKYAIDVCLHSPNAAAACRTLFASSIASGKKITPTTRVKQYLERFNLTINYSTMPPRISCLDTSPTGNMSKHASHESTT